jgi:DnaJ family protein C protein 7
MCYDFQLGRLNEAVADCTKALELDDTYLKALLRRAKCFMDLSDYEEAVKDYEKAFKMDKSRGKKFFNATLFLVRQVTTLKLLC